MTGGSWIAQRVSPVILAKSFAAVAFGVAIVMMIQKRWKTVQSERLNPITREHFCKAVGFPRTYSHEHQRVELM
ncbi:MAG: hypothetical protein OJF51_001318 [Nitrospira sp.]|nr:MAG: hypothetical protein OJF51_001318 [Nitrospira sp.]